MSTKLIWTLIALLGPAPLIAQHDEHHQSPYVGQESSGIAALSRQEADDLRNGAGMGLARAAELNHYPGPLHVLQLAAKLGLSPQQKAGVEQIHAKMLEEARRLGEQIVKLERHLDRRFAHRHIDESGLREATAGIASLQGELRFAHLRAHLETREVLSDAQVEQYDQLRGYAPAAAEPAAYVRFPRLTDPAGCLVEQITSEAYDEYQVQGVSRDGKLLSFSANRGESDAHGNQLADVYTLDLVTGTTTPLPASINNSGNFSPDGKHLVVAAYDDSGRTEILELRLQSGDITVIAPHEQWDWLPSYSADGRFIVFNSQRHEDQADIYLYERAGKKLQRLTRYPGYDAHAQFSPDGERILFHRMQSKREDGGYDFDIYVYQRRSATETRLTDGPYEESYAAFAPDGQHIVFSSDFEEAPEKHNLYIRAPDGSYTALTDGDWKDSYAYWTPDGKHVYFNSDRSGVTNIYRIPMQGVSCLRYDP